MTTASPYEFFLCRNIAPRVVERGYSRNYHILAVATETAREQVVNVTAEQVSDFISLFGDAPSRRHPVFVAEDDIVWCTARRDILGVRAFAPHQAVQGGDANSMGMWHTIELPVSAPRFA